MKKLLLSIFSIIAIAGMARAEVTLKVNYATDIKGTLVAEKPAEGNSNGEAEKYQPLESATISGYSFTFVQGEAKNAPALYKVMSGKEGDWTFRVYNGSSMTITAPEGTTMTQIDFAGQFSKLNATVSEGKFEATSNSAAVWSGKSNEITISTSSNIRVSTLTVYIEGEETPEVPEVPAGVTYAPATEIVSGEQYILVIDNLYGAAIAESSTYGRLALTEGTVADGKMTAPETAAITITKVDDKGYTLVDTYGRYLAMDESHLTTFQIFTEINDGCYWNAEFTEGKVKISNVLNPTCFVCQSAGNEGTFYTNMAPAKAPETFNLPALYVKEATGGISAVEIETNNGEAVYYNLQGIRVNADALTPGIYVRRQGNKSVKVLVR